MADLILGVENKAIGLYRTSFLSSEDFGIGRHPATKLYRAQDFRSRTVSGPASRSTGL